MQRQPPEVFYKKTVLKNFAIFTGKYLCLSLFFKALIHRKKLLKDVKQVGSEISTNVYITLVLKDFVIQILNKNNQIGLI